MSLLASFKLVSSKRTPTASPVILRRNKLISKIHQQLELCAAQKAGQKYSPKITKTFINRQTGEKYTAEVTKRVKEWFFVDNDGKLNLMIKYGAKTLNLNGKGANAILLKNGDELIAALTDLKGAVANGEFDAALEEASKETRTKFTKVI